MKIRKLTTEWGAAYIEAQPIEITHYGRKLTVYVNENHDLVVEASGHATVRAVNDSLQLTCAG